MRSKKSQVNRDIVENLPTQKTSRSTFLFSEKYETPCSLAGHIIGPVEKRFFGVRYICVKLGDILLGQNHLPTQAKEKHIWVRFTNSMMPHKVFAQFLYQQQLPVVGASGTLVVNTKTGYTELRAKKLW